VAERTMREKEYQLAMSDGTLLGRSFPSIWDLVKADNALEGKTDRRPFVYIAVGERSNHRVQIMRYFWTVSDVYRPTCESVYTVGGLRETFVPIRFPTCIDFSSSGELAICDTGLKKIYLLTPYMTLIKAFQVPFQCTETKKIKRSIRARKVRPAARAIDRLLDAHESGKGAMADDSDDDDDEFGLDGESNVEDLGSVGSGSTTGTRFKTVHTYDDKPVAVGFSPDGKLAVGYDTGAVAIYPVCRLAHVGDFCMLTVPAMRNILSFCSYPEVCVCVCLRCVCVCDACVCGVCVRAYCVRART
jgi:hypothetical protein